MKFSIVIPVYNVGKYIDRCLDSILNQTYKNFEAIIVNDGSTDNSQEIIDKYTSKDKRFACYQKSNGGVSDARNYGLDRMTGDYLLCVDPDDYIDKDLLLKLSEAINKKDVDLITFNSIVCDDNGNEISRKDVIEYENEDVNNIIKNLVTRPFVEVPWIYCYKISFWKKHGFRYAKGKIHEDYGLTPLILYNATTISSINYFGYYYVYRKGSITKKIDYDKIKKMLNDFYSQYVNIVELLDKEPSSIKKDVLMTYMTECLMLKSRDLTNEDYKKYIENLKKVNAFNRIVPYNLKKLIKRLVAKVSPKLYVKMFLR